MKLILVAFSFLTIFSAYSQTVPVAFPSSRSANAKPESCGPSTIKETYAGIILEVQSKNEMSSCNLKEVVKPTIYNRQSGLVLLCQNLSGVLFISQVNVDCTYEYSKPTIKIAKPQELSEWGNGIISNGIQI